MAISHDQTRTWSNGDSLGKCVLPNPIGSTHLLQIGIGSTTPIGSKCVLSIPISESAVCSQPKTVAKFDSILSANVDV